MHRSLRSFYARPSDNSRYMLVEASFFPIMWLLHVPLFVAKFGAAGAANAWYPPSYTGSDIVREGFAGIGANALLNIAREFGPELMRMVGLR